MREGVNCAVHGVWAVKRVRQDKAGRVGGSHTTKGSLAAAWESGHCSGGSGGMAGIFMNSNRT